MNLSDRDRTILRAQVSDKIETLLPITRMGLDWRPAFQAEAARLRTVANGRQSMSTGRSDALAWAFAHEFILEEQS